MEDQELVREGQSETANGREEEKPSEDLEGSGVGETEISHLWDGNVEIPPPDTEMQVSAVNYVRRTRNVGGEVGVLQALGILEYLVLCDAMGGNIEE